MKFKLTIDSEKEEEISILSHSANDFVAKIEDLVLSYNGNDSLFARNDDEIINLEFKEIACITIAERRTYAVDIKGEKYRINETLTGVEGNLPSYFIRINKSTIAN
jgi:DNA-binding LytR/AlgR family response regulator